MLRAEMTALTKAVDDGFTRVHKDLDEVKADLKQINGQSLDRRLTKLETWRDAMQSRAWAFMVGGAVAVVAAWAAVLFR